MADISKITALNGTTYNLKDATARSSIPAAATANPKMDGSVSIGTSTKYAREDHVHPSDTTKIDNNAKLFTTNSFAPANLRSLYISKIDNAFYAADQRFTVNCTVNNSAISSVKTMFDGNYETGFDIPYGQSATVTMDFSNLSGAKYPGYPYGYIFISFYSGRTPKSISGRLYNNYASQGVGWKELTVSKYDTNGYIWVTELSYYGLQTLELTITANDTSTYNQTRPVQIEFYNTRPNSSITPVVSKYREERLYYNLTAPKFIGALQGNADSATNATTVNNHTVNSDVPANAVFTDTINTYYGECSSSAYEVEKLVDCDDFTELTAGATINVLFYNVNLALNATLNVNDTGAKKITLETLDGTTADSGLNWPAGVVSFTYDGFTWHLHNPNRLATSTRSGLMSYTDKSKLDNLNKFYLTDTTPSSASSGDLWFIIEEEMILPGQGDQNASEPSNP